MSSQCIQPRDPPGLVSHKDWCETNFENTYMYHARKVLLRRHKTVTPCSSISDGEAKYDPTIAYVYFLRPHIPCRAPPLWRDLIQIDLQVEWYVFTRTHVSWASTIPLGSETSLGPWSGGGTTPSSGHEYSRSMLHVTTSWWNLWQRHFAVFIKFTGKKHYDKTNVIYILQKIHYGAWQMCIMPKRGNVIFLIKLYILVKQISLY